MAKTKRQIEEDLKLIDIVVELLDARIPRASKNPDFEKMIEGKTKIVVLNKSDLANEEINKKWLAYYQKKNILAVLTDSNSGKGIREAVSLMEKIREKQNESLVQKGRVGKSAKVMILGIPNVGKSSFINRISGRTSAQVGNRPGITRQKQWIRVSDKIELLDTPGVLWPRLDKESVALNLAFTGTIKDDILQKIDIAYFLLKFLLEKYRKNVVERYAISDEQIEECLANEDRMENENIFEILYLIAKKRGAIISGGNIDEERIASILLDDFRSGKLGKISMEEP